MSNRRHKFAGAALCVALASPVVAQELFEELRETCASCHGVDATEEVPALGGIDAYYALLQLVAFRDGQRENEIMSGMVADFSNDDLRAAADWVASLTRPVPPGGTPDPDRMEAGASLATEHRCASCHGEDYLGGHQIPPLRNQHEAYVQTSLLDYKAERRIGDRAAMVEVATALTDEEIGDLAFYVANLE